jgi:hypothetical protein
MVLAPKAKPPPTGVDDRKADRKVVKIFAPKPKMC